MILTAVWSIGQLTPPVWNRRMKYSAQVRLMMACEDGFRRKVLTQLKRNAGKGAHHVFFFSSGANAAMK